MMKAIPNRAEPVIYMETAFIDSNFVEVVSNDIFDVKMMYPILNMENAENKCYMRKEVLDKLFLASKLLPMGYKFRIWDAWRPISLQLELYGKYSRKIISEYNLDAANEIQVKKMISQFVSEPILDRDLPPVHTTGGAVDLTVVNAKGIELDMGSEYDEFTSRTYSSYYESEENKIVRDNRRILYNAMINVGFTNLPSEWWHFDYGNRFWAFYKRKPAIYRGVFTKGEF